MTDKNLPGRLPAALVHAVEHWHNKSKQARDGAGQAFSIAVARVKGAGGNAPAFDWGMAAV